MPNSTTKATRQKPAKPKDSPLFPHASGRWAKKIRGHFHYFGPWEDYDAALLKWLDEKDDLLAGREPRAKTVGLSILDLVNRFLTAKEIALKDGELADRTFQGYHRACDRVLKVLGKHRLVDDLASKDFEALRVVLSKTMGHSARMVEIQKTRTLFKYAYDDGLIDKPVRFGLAFKGASKKTLQKDMPGKKEARKLEAEQIRAMMDGAGVYLRAMILLGINCGFGNYDCATLTFKALDLEGGWVDHPRPKTGVERRAKLWPETVAALREAIAQRREPKSPNDVALVFITTTGRPWVRMVKPGNPESGWTDSITCLARLLMRKLGINHGASFYSLRRMTETVGGGCKDQVAVDAVMGHSRGDMASVYRLEIDDERLEAVADHIHGWLFPTSQVAAEEGTK